MRLNSHPRTFLSRSGVQSDREQTTWELFVYEKKINYPSILSGYNSQLFTSCNLRPACQGSSSVGSPRLTYVLQSLMAVLEQGVQASSGCKLLQCPRASYHPGGWSKPLHIAVGPKLMEGEGGVWRLSWGSRTHTVSVLPYSISQTSLRECLGSGGGDSQ